MIVSAAVPNGNLLLASPLATLARLAALAATGEFWQTIAASSGRILGGFLVSCALAVCLAALSARFRRVREGLAPAVAVIKAVPVMSFIILTLLWVKPAALSPLIAGLMVFPPVYLNLLTGIDHTDRELLEMARVFRVPFSRRLTGIYVPQTLPYFRSAVSLALGLCWKAGVAAEVLGVVKTSLGGQLYNAKIYFETADLFAWTLVIVGLSAAFEWLALRVLDAFAGKVGGAWK
jgi:NitT/TauT family transport system permease protein